MQHLIDSMCPICCSRVYRDTVTNVTHADHEGNPVETTSVGIWCVNDDCVHSTEGLDEDELIPTKRFHTECVSDRLIYGICRHDPKTGERVPVDPKTKVKVS